MCSENVTIHLVGVDHRIQYTNDSCGLEWKTDIQKLEDYLVSKTRELYIELIAEEFNEELAERNQATAITARDAAKRCGIRHLFCEPTSAERETMRSTAPDARETFWLQRLKETDFSRVIFVCGNDHVQTFAGKLEQNGYVQSIMGKGWGGDWMWK